MTDAPRGRLARILAFASIVEVATSFALLLWPALVIRLLLGVESVGATLAIARLSGIALLTLGWACWPSRCGPQGPSNATRAMLAYNAAVALYLAGLGVVHAQVGLLLWPAVVLHAAVAALMLRAARRED